MKVELEPVSVRALRIVEQLKTEAYCNGHGRLSEKQRSVIRQAVGREWHERLEPLKALQGYLLLSMEKVFELEQAIKQQVSEEVSKKLTK